MTTTTTTSGRAGSPSLLDKIDEIAQTPLAEFDAFPKLPSTYKARSESRGFITIFVTFVAFLLVLNDLGEYIWGWPDYEFSVDDETGSNLNINVDMVVNMPCQYLSVDLRDAIGDRLYLSDGFRRDGTLFDIGQATTLKEHAEALSARQAIAQSRSSRGFFATLFRRDTEGYKPTYNYQSDGSACRVYGTVEVKKVTANLHVTTLGHGYASHQHVPHHLMNLSHVITEFSFGPYFPNIVQPLDNSFELTSDPFVAYTYFLHVVPTTYIAPRSKPLKTHQYSVTHYTRIMEHNKGVPGIFFRFDMDPLSLTIHQRTTSLLALFIRCVGVVGGVFVCMGYAVRIGTHAIDVVTGADKTPGIVAAEASGIGRKWLGGDLRSRGARHGENGSPYSSYANTPVMGTFSTPTSPFISTGGQNGGSHYLSSPSFGPGPSSRVASNGFPSPAPTASPLLSPSPYTPSSVPLPTSPPMTGGLYSHFPPTPNAANGNGSPYSPRPETSSFAAQQATFTPPPPRSRHTSNGSLAGNTKKDD